MSTGASLDQPIDWVQATSADRLLLQEVEVLLSHHPKLLRLLFDRSRPQLKESPSSILARARGLSSGEYLLVRLALEIWNSTGNVRILEPVERLDQDNFDTLIACLYRLRGQ